MIDEMIEQATKTALKLKTINPGDKVVITAGLPLYEPGTTNLIKNRNGIAQLRIL